MWPPCVFFFEALNGNCEANGEIMYIFLKWAFEKIYL